MVYIVPLLIVVVCCHYCTCIHADYTDWFSFKKRLSFNFTIEPSLSVGSVRQFWTSAGLWYVAQLQFEYLINLTNL